MTDDATPVMNPSRYSLLTTNWACAKDAGKSCHLKDISSKRPRTASPGLSVHGFTGLSTVLVDLNMPRMGGMELIAHLREWTRMS